MINSRHSLNPGAVSASRRSRSGRIRDFPGLPRDAPVHPGLRGRADVDLSEPKVLRLDLIDAGLFFSGVLVGTFVMLSGAHSQQSFLEGHGRALARFAFRPADRTKPRVECRRLPL